MVTQKTKDLINTVKNNGSTYSVFRDTFEAYVKCGGIDKLRKVDLDEMIKEMPGHTITYDPFMDIYKLVSANESGRIIKIWTWVAGLASLVSLGVSIFSLYRSTPP